MGKMNGILKKCKSLSRLGRSSSYSSLRSKSIREEDLWGNDASRKGEEALVFVGSSRRRYMVSLKHLNHPLLNALMERSNYKREGEDKISINCEVVLFDHLLWMLENGDPDLAADGSLEELAYLYAS